MALLPHAPTLRCCPDEGLGWLKLARHDAPAPPSGSCISAGGPLLQVRTVDLAAFARALAAHPVLRSTEEVRIFLTTPGELYGCARWQALLAPLGALDGVRGLLGQVRGQLSMRMRVCGVWDGVGGRDFHQGVARLAGAPLADDVRQHLHCHAWLRPQHPNLQSTAPTTVLQCPSSFSLPYPAQQQVAPADGSGHGSAEPPRGDSQAGGSPHNTSASAAPAAGLMLRFKHAVKDMGGMVRNQPKPQQEWGEEEGQLRGTMESCRWVGWSGSVPHQGRTGCCTVPLWLGPPVCAPPPSLLLPLASLIEGLACLGR